MKLDLGCGTKKKEGFTGVDAINFPGVDVVLNVGKDPWPWKDGEVEEVHCSHMIEHLTWPERVHFFNELCRVMKQGAKCQLIFPHWASMRYYGDPTHESPFSEFAFYYLLKSWRDANAPHVGYTCDFDATWGFSLRQDLMTRNAEYQRYAIENFKEAIQDIIATLVKR